MKAAIVTGACGFSPRANTAFGNELKTVKPGVDYSFKKFIRHFSKYVFLDKTRKLNKLKKTENADKLKENDYGNA